MRSKCRQHFLFYFCMAMFYLCVFCPYVTSEEVQIKALLRLHGIGAHGYVHIKGKRWLNDRSLRELHQVLIQRSGYSYCIYLSDIVLALYSSSGPVTIKYSIRQHCASGRIEAPTTPRALRSIIPSKSTAKGGLKKTRPWVRDRSRRVNRTETLPMPCPRLGLPKQPP